VLSNFVYLIQQITLWYVGKAQYRHQYTRYHGVELGHVSCGKQTFGCGI